MVTYTITFEFYLSSRQISVNTESVGRACRCISGRVRIKLYLSYGIDSTEKLKSSFAAGTEEVCAMLI